MNYRGLDVCSESFILLYYIIYYIIFLKIIFLRGFFYSRRQRWGTLSNPLRKKKKKKGLFSHPYNFPKAKYEILYLVIVSANLVGKERLAGLIYWGQIMRHDCFQLLIT
jgi:hypothetical protein